MEPKKNPKYDLHQQRGVLLNVGLVVSLILVIAAFKWTAPIRETTVDLPLRDPFSDALLADQPRPTDFNQKPIPQLKRIQPPAPVAANIVELTNLIEPIDDNTPIVDQGQINNPIDIGVINVPIEPQPLDTFRIVEKMPEPIGGWKVFYETLGKHIKYPKRAERAQAGGKVYVEFTVNAAGQLSNLKILKGVGYGCDEEASRVLALTKWNAGKQRGRPVNVRMVQPITFSIK
jgi:protein TonB